VLLAESLQDAYPFPAQRPELLIPVPLADRRLRLRGHNQAILIAVQVSRILSIPLKRRCARRIRDTEILADLGPRQRRAQVAQGFTASSLPAGSRVAIIDDVVTTGATAMALAGALQRAGAAEVHLWVASAAPQPG
jgi:predicted amidophosphoribosyltransferase